MHAVPGGVDGPCGDRVRARVLLGVRRRLERGEGQFFFYSTASVAIFWGTLRRRRRAWNLCTQARTDATSVRLLLTRSLPARRPSSCQAECPLCRQNLNPSRLLPLYNM